MKIKSITMKNFMVHDYFSLSFPDKGIVSISGENGKGKSAIIDAVQWAIWGNTSKDTPTRPSGEMAEVILTIDDVTIHKTQRRGKSATVSVQVLENKELFDTKTKAQELLTKKFGDMVIWKTKMVLTGDKSAVFSESTDAERKRLLESVLYASLFENLQDASRDNEALAESRLKDAYAQQAKCEKEIEYISKRIEDLKITAATTIEPFSYEDARILASLEVETKQLYEEHTILGEKLSESTRKSQEILANMEGVKQHLVLYKRDISKLEKEVSHMSLSRRCVTCNTLIADNKVAILLGDRNKEIEKNKFSVEALNLKLEELQGQWNGYKSSIEKIQSDYKNLENIKKQKAQTKTDYLQKQKSFSIFQSAKENCDQKIKELSDTLKLEEVRFNSFGRNLKEIEQDLEEAKHLTKIFGIKGFRIVVLEDVLRSISNIATEYLKTLSGLPDTKILLGVKESGAGHVLSLNVSGQNYGADLGYKATSKGQKKRVNLSILLALSEVAEMSQGLSKGTLFIDEAFDGLDVDGVEKVINLAEEVARDRCIVIISHEDRIIKNISGKKVNLDEKKEQCQ